MVLLIELIALVLEVLTPNLELKAYNFKNL
jgi:hypothetical protein